MLNLISRLQLFTCQRNVIIMDEGKKPSPLTYLGNQMNVTLKSPKEEIITSSLEIVDSLSSQNKNLKEEKRALLAVLAVTFTLGWLF